MMSKTKTSNSQDKSRKSLSPSVKPKSPILTQLKTQKFNIALQQKLKFNDITHQSIQGLTSSNISRERQIFLDQRLRNFHKVMTDSLQRHSFMRVKQLTNQGSSLSQSKFDSRITQPKIVLENQQQNQKKEKLKLITKEILTHKKKLSSGTQSLNSANIVRNLTPSPKSKIKTKSQLFTQINSLLQSAHSGNRVENSPPSSVTKRITGDILYIRSSLYSSSSNINVFSVNETIKPQQAKEICLIQDQSQQKDLLEQLTKRVQSVLCQHYNDKVQWKQEQSQLQQRLNDLEKLLELQLNLNLNQSTLVFIDEPKVIVEVDIVETSDNNQNDQSFGLLLNSHKLF